MLAQLAAVASFTFTNGATVTLHQLAPVPPTDSFCLPARVRTCQVTPRPDTAYRLRLIVLQGTKADTLPLSARGAMQGYWLAAAAVVRQDTAGPFPVGTSRVSITCDALMCRASINDPTRWGSSYAYLRPGPLPKAEVQQLADALWFAATGLKRPWQVYPYTWRQS